MLLTPLKYPISVFVTEPIVAEEAVIAATLISANANPDSAKFTEPEGLAVASLNALITPSEASLTIPANLRFVAADVVPAGLTAADVTFVAVLAYVNVVDVGTLATTCVPLNVASTPPTTTMSPIANEWAVVVVNVATSFANALLVTVLVSVAANAVPYSLIRPRSTASVELLLPTKIKGSATARVDVSRLVPAPPNVMLPAIFTSPWIPTPPTTVSAPVEGDVESVAISM